MANALTVLDNAPQLPADVASFFDEGTNLAPRETVPSLSYEGKTWTISLNGEKTKLMRKNADGDEEALPIMRVIILDYNQRRGRALYEGAYDPAKPQMPVCWSDDGIAPSQHCKNKKSATCSTCPLSVKGSKVTEQGKATTACSEHRMIVVIPANRLDFEPLRLKLAITSDYDGQSPDKEAQGWFAFKNYTDMLRKKQVKHTAMLVTKMKMDPDAQYPKVLFSADKWLEPDQLSQIPTIVKDERVKKLIDGSWTPDGVDGKPVEQVTQQDPVQQVLQQARPAAPVVAKPAPAPVSPPAPVGDRSVVGMINSADEDDGGEPELPGPAPAASKPRGRPPKATTAAPQEKPVAKPATNGAASPDDLDSLLADWA